MGEWGRRQKGGVPLLPAGICMPSSRGGQEQPEV